MKLKADLNPEMLEAVETDKICTVCYTKNGFNRNPNTERELHISCDELILIPKRKVKEFNLMM